MPLEVFLGEPVSCFLEGDASDFVLQEHSRKEGESPRIGEDIVVKFSLGGDKMQRQEVWADTENLYSLRQNRTPHSNSTNGTQVTHLGSFI